MGGPAAVEKSSTGGHLVGDPPAHDEGFTEEGLIGGSAHSLFRFTSW